LFRNWLQLLHFRWLRPPLHRKESAIPPVL
jgi:hypothetical protein